MLENLHEATREPEDPGLREIYASLPRLPLTIVAPKMGKAINQGGILRNAEAFRVENVIFEPEDDQAEEFSGGIGIWDYQSFCFANIVETLRDLRSEGRKIYGLTLNSRARSLENTTWDFPAVLVLGEERAGLRPELESLCDEFVAIPLYGMITSLNVAVASGLALQNVASEYARINPEFLPARRVSKNLINSSLMLDKPNS